MGNFEPAGLRETIGRLATDHDASGEQQPQVGEVFAPRQHASALAPDTMIVVGARGAGKSFWAGVLGQDATKDLAAEVYPNLGLERLIVRYGYTGIGGGTAAGRQTIDRNVPQDDHDAAVRFWQIVILRAALDAVGDSKGDHTLSDLAREFDDPELFERQMRHVDHELMRQEKSALVIFDALDTLAREWRRLTLLTDALFEAVWALRAMKGVKAKIFIRPDQLNDEGLRFVELPKLRNGRVELNWTRRDLYGLLYSRIYEEEQARRRVDFQILAAQEGASVPQSSLGRLRQWPLALSEDKQKRMMERLSGPYMGAGSNKGATYPWAFNHLADARGVVTPRSFLKLFVEAAQYTQSNSQFVLTPEAIRHGLREASKTRVEQLALEYRWIKRALAPLAGLKVPCSRYDIHELWMASNTVEIIETAAKSEGFLPPYRASSDLSKEEALELALVRVGVLSYRPDGQADIPDLFRIAARMFKLGGVALQGKI
ncbi:hypothetical protein [Methylorubrum extorquens]